MPLLDHLHGFWKCLTLLLLVDAIIIAASPSQLSTARASTLSSELVAVLKRLNNTQAAYNASLMLSTIESQTTPNDSLAENSHRRDSHSNVACRISRIVFGSSKYIDASSPIYVNETDMNW